MSNRQAARDMQVEFQARFQAKQARREAQKAAKQDPILKKQIQELLKKGETQKAYQKAKMLLSKQALASQMDQVADMAELSAAQIQANNAMNRMTHMMAQSSKVMSVAQKNATPAKVSLSLSLSLFAFFPSQRIDGMLTEGPKQSLGVLENFKEQNEEYAMTNNIYQDAFAQSTSAQVPEDAVHELLGKLADDAGIELNQQLTEATPAETEPASAEVTAEDEDKLQQRLRALRA
jgi:charged multivesicular body protein 1